MTQTRIQTKLHESCKDFKIGFIFTSISKGKGKMSFHDMLSQAERAGGGVTPKHSEPDTRRRSVVSITLRPLYLKERTSTNCTGGWVCLGVDRGKEK